MPTASNVYINADELNKLPSLNRENYLYEAKLLEKELSKGANVLQVGSMDGLRIIRLLAIRPDLRLTGLELEEDLVEVAKKNVAEKSLNVTFIAGDITNPPEFQQFDYVICLNNTLGYIPNQNKAITEMKRLGKSVVISVYGEKFDDELARKYFKHLDLEIENIKANIFDMKDFTKVKRYTKKEVISWGGRIINTPIGYFTVLD